MRSFLGYNFSCDRNALNESIETTNNFYKTTIQNAIFDHFNMTKNISFIYDEVVENVWDYFTIMNADFNGNLNAGNIEFSAMQATSIIIKRREETTFDWIKIAEKKINSPNDYSFIFNDATNASNTDYEYALFPVLNGIEGSPIIGKITSEFDGAFIVDQSESFKFEANIEHGDMSSVHKVSVFEPIGAKYPTVISNGKNNYRKGNIKGALVTIKDDGSMDIKEITRRLKLMETFLKNGRAKILKDLTGLHLMVSVVGDVQISYESPIGSGLISVSFDWVEVGDTNDNQDLDENNLSGKVF